MHYTSEDKDVNGVLTPRG